jgi:hypothetical protein
VRNLIAEESKPIVMHGHQSIRTIAGIAIFILSTSTQTLAVCGDVTGDSQVKTADALRVLRASVGQNVQMICDLDTPPIENYVGYLNLLQCNASNFTSTLTWSEHSALSWSSSTNRGDGNPHYKRVDDLIIAGQLDVSFGACGDLVIDIDSSGLLYPMPYVGGAIFIFTYDGATNTVVLWVADAPAEAALSVSRNFTRGTILASVAAPTGLR